MTCLWWRRLTRVNAVEGVSAEADETNPCSHGDYGCADGWGRSGKSADVVRVRTMSTTETADMQARWIALFSLLLASTSAWAATPPGADPEFESTHGQHVSLADYRGQVVVLNLWAIWCGPCIAEIPELVELQHRIEPLGATVIGLAADSGSADQILGFWHRRLELEPNYPLWFTSMEQARTHFGATTIPLTLLIDREGVVRDRLLGAHDAQTLMERLQPLL